MERMAKYDLVGATVINTTHYHVAFEMKNGSVVVVQGEDFDVCSGPDGMKCERYSDAKEYWRECFPSYNR